MSKGKPISSTQLQSWINKLNEFERNEINMYLDSGIYFLGLGAEKIIPVKSKGYADFDDDNKYYIVKARDHVQYRYEIITLIGQGAFSRVYEAYDHKELETVAVKILRSPLIFHKVFSAESKKLTLLSKQYNRSRSFTVCIKDKFVFRNHPCIVTEYMFSDLYTELKVSFPHGMPLRNIHGITHCLLHALCDFSKILLVHADIKPVNIGVTDEDVRGAKMLDLGSSFHTFETHDHYVQTRYYRAPEVIFQQEPYSTAIDMWSLGCVLVELYTGDILFQANTTPSLIASIIEVLGLPPSHMVDSAIGIEHLTPDGQLRRSIKERPPHGLLESASRTARNRRGIPNTRSLDFILMTTCDKDFNDFVKKCLTWNPKERLTPQDALKHKWIRKYNRAANIVPTRFARLAFIAVFGLLYRILFRTATRLGRFHFV